MSRCRRPCSFLPRVLAALLISACLLIAAAPWSPPTAAALGSQGATPAQVEQLNAALDGVQDALDQKVHFDTDSVATSF